MLSRIVLGSVLLLVPLLRGLAAPEAMLIAIGDQHSAYERYPQFLARIDRLRSEHPGVPFAIVIDGDVFEAGNAVARRTAGALDFALLAACAQRAPTILNLGNHDADLQPLADVVSRLETLGVIVISGNLRERATEKACAPPLARVQLGRHELTMVGVVTDRLDTFRVAERPMLDVSPPVTWARDYFPELLRHAEVPVVLSHAGLRVDRQMLPLVSNGALFIGAHDHLRFVHPEDRTVYFQSGCWLECVSIATLVRQPDGLGWTVVQEPLAAGDPADRAMEERVRVTFAKTLTPAETAIVAHTARAFTPAEAARFAVEAVRMAAGADAAVIGGTTFGGGLPGGDVTRFAFDDCVRFDGTVYTTEIGGAELQRILAHANQGPRTPFAERTGENLVAVVPSRIDAHARYRLVTTDWIGRNPARLPGEGAPRFVEVPTLHLKAAVLAALARASAQK